MCLLNEKDKMIIGKAEVLDIDQGDLGEMCLVHARDNHQELNSDSIYAPQRVFSTMQKFYGPHIATVQRKATVIYLRRIE